MYPALVQGQAQQPAAFFGGALKAVKHKIAQAVNNGLAPIGFCALGDMRMAADHGIGAGVNQRACQLALAGAGLGFPLPTPVHKWNHHIGASSARSADVGHHLGVLAPGNAGLAGPGLK